MSTNELRLSDKRYSLGASDQPAFPSQPNPLPEGIAGPRNHRMRGKPQTKTPTFPGWRFCFCCNGFVFLLVGHLAGNLRCEVACKNDGGYRGSFGDRV